MSGVDGGVGFGLWPQATAQFMYHDVMPALLNGFNVDGRSVVDLGGGNGLLKRWIPHAVSVDVDADKRPDVHMDLRDVRASGLMWDAGVLRYVLHYMDDAAASTLMRDLRYVVGELLLIQFVNDHLAAKRANSVNEVKWFRDEAGLRALLSGWQVADRRRIDYRVRADFYRWRLQHPNPTDHDEAIVAYHLRQ